MKSAPPVRARSDISRELGAVTELHVALELVLDAALRVPGVDAGGAYVWNDATGAFDLVTHRNLPPPFVDAARSHPYGAPNVASAERGEPVFTDFASVASGDRHDPVDLRALAVLPMLHEGRLVAVMNVASRTVEAFDAEARAALLGLAALVSGAVARVRAEHALREDKRNLEALFDSMRDMVFVADRKGRIRHVNREVLRRLGFTREELRTRTVLDLHPREVRAQALSIVQRISENDEDVVFELPMLTKAGGRVIVDVVVTRGRFAGEPVVFGVARDVTERRAVEAALRGSQQRLSVALAAAEQEPWELDFERMHMQLGPIWGARLAVPPPGRPLQETLAAVVHPDDRDAVQARLARHIAGETELFESEHRAPPAGGVERWVRICGKVIARDERGAPTAIAGTVTDVTARRALEDQAVLSDRLAAVGRLAAGVAHEVNNPLAYVLGNVEFAIEALEKSAPESPLLAPLREARGGALRMRDIVQDLKALARADDAEVDSAAVADVLRAATNLTKNEVRARATLLVDVAADLPRVRGPERRLVQVFVNLLVNAAHALPEGDHGAHEVRVTARRANGAVEISVHDTGVGIPADVLPRIFDPFFTTKPSGQGSGLGLSISHAIVTAAGGDIRVESTVGAGTTFTVVLQPAAAAAVAAPRTPPSEAAVEPRRAAVLVVDDEALVGRVIARILAAHDVTVVTSVQAAMAQLEVGDFDLVLCDLTMPALDGIDLWEAVARARPELRERVVFMSGGAFTPRATSFLEANEVPCLSKPVDAAALRAFVASRVDRGGAGRR